MSIFHLPDLGEGLADATVVRWHVQAGDEIRAEQLLVSVETDKAIVDIPSPQTGRIDALLAREGEVVPTHAALVRFADAEPTSTDAGSVVGSLPQHDVQMPSTDFLIGRHRHTEARMQQSQQRRAARAVVTKTESWIDGGGRPCRTGTECLV
jgi:2-oxoisovalerate dehydrogenase E2 component (dihydrolipoyl transacylase)